MKTNLIYLFIKIIALMTIGTLLFTSCSKGKNKVASDNLPYAHSPIYNTYHNNQVASIKSQFPCQRKPDITFSTTQVSTQYNQTTLGGAFSPTTIPGTAERIYVGKSAWKDLIIVAKMPGGAGFNVTLSFCIVANVTPPHFDKRGMSNFQAPQGITLDDPVSNTDGVGSVDAASNTVIMVEPYQFLPVFQLVTSFTDYKL